MDQSLQAPTPRNTTLRMPLLLGAQRRHGATVVHISAPFLYASLVQDGKVAVTSPTGFFLRGHAAILGKSLYGLPMARPLWAGNSRAEGKSLGLRRGKLDPV